MLPEKRKLNILVDILGNSYRSGNELLFFCPKCKHHKRKLSVNVDKDAFKCWVCDYHGRSIRRLVRRYGSFNQRAEWDEITGRVDLNLFGEDLFGEEEKREEQKIKLPEEFISLTNDSLPIHARPAIKYLRNRGITNKDITRWKIGYCPAGEYSGRIVIPSFGSSGYCNYFVSRTYSSDWPKYKNPQISRDIVFNHLYVDWDSDLVLVEGVFDAIVSGPNSVPLLGSSIREGAELFQEIVKNDTPVYVALDPDAEKKSMYLINKLLEYGIEVYKINISPYGDVGEMTREIFNERKKEAVLMSGDNYLLRAINSI